MLIALKVHQILSAIFMFDLLPAVFSNVFHYKNTFVSYRLTHIICSFYTAVSLTSLTSSRVFAFLGCRSFTPPTQKSFIKHWSFTYEWQPHNLSGWFSRKVWGKLLQYPVFQKCFIMVSREDTNDNNVKSIRQDRERFSM